MQAKNRGRSQPHRLLRSGLACGPVRCDRAESRLGHGESECFFPTGLNLSFSRRLFLLCGGKNMLDVCCDLTPYETSRWLELKPDRENVTRSGTVSITYGTNATPE